MLIALLMFEIILAALIILTTCMVENKFKYIKESLKMYNDAKAYTTEERVAFIEAIIKRYECGLEETKTLPDIDSIVKTHLSNEYIGKFPYVSVKSIATKLKQVMWGIIVIEILVIAINQQGATLDVVIIASLSAILTVGIEFYTVIRGLEEKSEDIITEVSDYVVNTYKEQESKKIKEIKNVKIVKNKIITLDRAGNQIKARLTSEQEAQLEAYKDKILKEKENNGLKQEITLNAQDIAQFLGILSQYDSI